MSNRLRPFFSFYGSKWRAAPLYPQPIYDTIIEPFAGSAGYSLLYPDSQVKLVDIDPTICGVWDYLIHVSPNEIRKIPIDFECIDDLNVPPEARSLVGFWLNKGSVSPCRHPSAWMREDKYANQFWGIRIRERIADQVDRIRHWTISNSSYSDIDSTPVATYFIDPPYSSPAGLHYKFNAIDYDNLANYARALPGQVIVCEQDGATWLPFQKFASIQSMASRNGKKRSEEVIWYNLD